MQFRTIYTVTGHLSEGSFVRNGVVEIPKCDANPNPNSNPNLIPIRFGQMTLRISELSPNMYCIMNIINIY